MPRLSDTYVYIDGFNLYYGALKRNHGGLKWLDLHRWLTILLPKSNITKIKFFTARVISELNDPQKANRQNIYLRALATTPKVEVIFGNFKKRQVKIPITTETSFLGSVWEEKRTDVNLASHLVNDAHLGRFETAVVVSNDSDLSEAVKIVSTDVKRPVGIINPCIGQAFSQELIKHSSLQKEARYDAIKGCQFPDSLADQIGTFTKPKSW